MNPVSITQFRSDFPEFADSTKYSDAMVAFWLNVAATLVNVQRWASLAVAGQELVTAHYLVIAARDETAAANGTPPGQVVGLQTAKSVADLSASYDYQYSVVQGAGFWNQTSYGQRYFSLARLFGAGGLQFPQFNC
jgi:hypothetical protein